MSLPFTEQEFLDVFRQYNQAVWPAQIVLVAVALLSLWAAVRGGARAGRIVAACLAAEWCWTGILYHWTFFSQINQIARGFAVLWVLGGTAFAWAALRPQALTFTRSARWRQVVGFTLFVYALAVYPLIGHLGGRAYPFAPTFGAPCPVTIATFGLLWLARPGFSRLLLAAPILWALVGSTAAFRLGVIEDLGLMVAGLSGLVLAFLPAPRTGAATAGVSERV